MKEDVFHLGIKALIRNSAGKILLLLNNPKNKSGLNPPHWDLPGGRVKFGDGVEATLKREVEEEIGIRKIKIIRFLDAAVSNFRMFHGKKLVGLVLFTYLCEVENTEEVRLTDDEHIRFKWCTPVGAAKLLKVKFGDSLSHKVEKL